MDKPLGENPPKETERYIQCKICQAWFDYRDLRAVLAHVGPLPHNTTPRM
jgi:hypothetical protein